MNDHHYDHHFNEPSALTMTLIVIAAVLAVAFIVQTSKVKEARANLIETEAKLDHQKAMNVDLNAILKVLFASNTNPILINKLYSTNFPGGATFTPNVFTNRPTVEKP